MQPGVVFFGTEAFSLAALQALVEHDYDVRLVVTKPDQSSGRGMKLRAPVVKTYALEHGIAVVQPHSLSEITDAITAIPTRIGVLSSFGKIIPQATLDLFEQGIINIHPSLLPRYRGPSPIETAIVNGDTQTGVSLMRLVARMDAGPVYVQRRLALSETTRASDLYTLCAQTGGQLLIESLPAIVSGELQPTDQDESLATYTALLSKKDGALDPATLAATDCERRIRAFEDYPRTRLTLLNYDVIVTQAHVAEQKTDPLSIQCADKMWLVVDQVIAPSGKSLSAAEFVRGYSA